MLVEFKKNDQKLHFIIVLLTRDYKQIHRNIHSFLMNIFTDYMNKGEHI